MSRVLLTITCAARDADSIARALADLSHGPVHQRSEAVLGRDFGDAATAERVAGTLARIALEIELPAEAAAFAVETVRDARRRLPFRWRTVAIIDGGRVE